MQYNSKYRLFSKAFLCFLVGFVTSIAVAQKATKKTTQQLGSYELYKGVIVDKGNNAIYLINPNGGLDRVAISSGVQKWHSKFADLPIVVQGSLLLAQKQVDNTGELVLAMLDTATGSLKQERLFKLTNGIRADIYQSLDSKFNINANSNMRDKISWSYQHQVVQGMLSEKPPVLTKQYGEITLDNSSSLNSANFTTLAQEPPSLSSNVEGSYLSNINGRQFKSASKEYILVSNISKSSKLLDRYNWDVYNLSGTLLGSVKHASAFRPFVLQGDLILFVNMPHKKVNKTSIDSFPLTLNAYSLNTGNPVWTKEIRDLSYKGKQPH